MERRFGDPDKNPCFSSHCEYNRWHVIPRPQFIPILTYREGDEKPI